QMHGDALVTQALAELAEHVQTGAVDMVDRRENQQQIPGVRIVAQGLQDGPLNGPGVGEEDVLVDAYRQQSRLDLHKVPAGIAEVLGAGHPAYHRDVGATAPPQLSNYGQAHTQHYARLDTQPDHPGGGRYQG